MTGRAYAWQLCLLLAPAFLLDGCSSTPIDEINTTAPKEPRIQREARLQSSWRGRPYNALLEAYGFPKMVMSIPGRHPFRASIVVYGVVDKMTDCIDAFTVAAQGYNGEMTVMDYFCR